MEKDGVSCTWLHGDFRVPWFRWTTESGYDMAGPILPGSDLIPSITGWVTFCRGKWSGLVL